MNKLISSEEIYRKTIHEIGVEIGDKVYWAKIATEVHDYAFIEEIISIEDDFGVDIEEWSDEISEEIMESFNNAISSSRKK